MKAVLDLRFNGKLHADLCPVFEQIASGCRRPFNEVVSMLSAPHKDSLDWWVQGPASRNTFASPFFHYYCCIHFIRHLLVRRSFEFAEVIVDSLAVKQLIENILDAGGIGHCQVRFARNLNCLARRIKTRYLAMPVLFIKRVLQHYIARSTRRSLRGAHAARPMVLIDTFVTAAYVSEDRWYGALWDNLAEETKAETFFVPTVVTTPLTQMRATYSSLRAGPRNVLIKDDYLKLGDIAQAFRYRRRATSLLIAPVEVGDSDVSGLVREELANNQDILTTIESILTCEFMRRLRERGGEVRLAIDWFEGQVIDKAWNLAVKRHYPHAKRIGYRAFESFPFYLCSYPIPIEREAGVIPDVIAVQGRGTIATVREFLPDLDVIVIPSFKSQHVWECDVKRQGDVGVFTILVTLPISTQASVRIVERLLEIHRSVNVGQRSVRYIVKPHPAVGAKKVTSRIGQRMPDSFAFSCEPSFVRLLSQADLLVTEASSTCLEALARGVPVIVMANEEGLTYDPVPATIPRSLFRKTKSPSELIDAIAYFANLAQDAIEQQRVDGRKIREDYFEPITREGIERFMDVAQHSPSVGATVGTIEETRRPALRVI